jgi:hypothetical protein
MARLQRIIERLLEHLAIPTEGGKLIYPSMLCMSWAAFCDRKSALSSKRDSKVTGADA